MCVRTAFSDDSKSQKQHRAMRFENVERRDKELRKTRLGTAELGAKTMEHFQRT